MEETSQQTEKLLNEEKKPVQEETFFDKYIAGEQTKGMFNPTAKDVVDTATDFIPGVSETKDIISLGTNVGKREYVAAGIDLASLILGAVPVLGDFARKGFRTLVKNEDIVSKQADEVGESLQKIIGNAKPPEKTVKAYKLFKTDKKGNLYPLFVKMKDNKPLELNKWTKAEAGELNPKTGKVKSSLGDLAYRPGFHGGDLPIATHIGGKKGNVTKPNYRKDNQVWAEVEFGNDKDWQSVANSRAVRNKDGSIQVKTAHITDQVPEGGHYRYKTNPNMTGNWLIGGELKINKVLTDKEVKFINDKAGVADLPRLKDLKLKESKKLFLGGNVMNEDVMVAEKPKYDFSDENLVNLPPQILENFLAKKYGVDAYMRERSSVFDESSRNEITDRESILTGPEQEALSINFANQIKKAKGMKKGGMPQQMELFQEGGLKDEGGTIDPVSGNDVPSGSTQEEVRDDIPAQLSEGEFVFPADVVRYIGLEKLMMIRQRAKAGLQRMEEMGQMGNSEEAILPDDIPFDIEDLDMEDDPIEMQVGGVVTTNPNTGNPTNMMGGVTNTVTGNPVSTGMYNPNVNQMYTPGGVTPYAPATFQSLLPQSSTGQVQTEMIRFVNKETGQVRMIPFNKATGTSLYPIDNLLQQGFVREEEKPKEVAKTTKVATTKVKPVEQDSGDDGPPPTTGAIDLAGDPLSYKTFNPFSMDALDKNFAKIAGFQASLINPKSAVGQGLFSQLTGKPEIAQMKLAALKPAYEDIKNNLKDKDGNSLKGTNVVKASSVNRNIISNELDRISDELDAITENRTTKETIEYLNDLAEKYGIRDYDKIDPSRTINVSSQIGKAFAQIDKKEREMIRKGEISLEDTRFAGTLVGEDPIDDSTSISIPKSTRDRTADKKAILDRIQKATPKPYTDTGQEEDKGTSVGTDSAFQDVGYGKSGDYYTAKGGFIKKPKPKVKKMKRGGLASR